MQSSPELLRGAQGKLLIPRPTPPARRQTDRGGGATLLRRRTCDRAGKPPMRRENPRARRIKQKNRRRVSHRDGFCVCRLDRRSGRRGKTRQPGKPARPANQTKTAAEFLIGTVFAFAGLTGASDGVGKPASRENRRARRIKQKTAAEFSSGRFFCIRRLDRRFGRRRRAPSPPLCSQPCAQAGPRPPRRAFSAKRGKGAPRRALWSPRLTPRRGSRSAAR